MKFVFLNKNILIFQIDDRARKKWTRTRRKKWERERERERERHAERKENFHFHFHFHFHFLIRPHFTSFSLQIKRNLIIGKKWTSVAAAHLKRRQEAAKGSNSKEPFPWRHPHLHSQLLRCRGKPKVKFTHIFLTQMKYTKRSRFKKKMNILILYLDITVAKIYNYGNDVNSLGREFSLRYYCCCLFYHFSMKFSILVADT